MYADVKGFQIAGMNHAATMLDKAPRTIRRADRGIAICHKTMKGKFRKRVKAASASELAQVGVCERLVVLNAAMESAMPPLSARQSGVA